MHAVVFTGGEYPEPAKTAVYWQHAVKPSLTVAADAGLETAVLFGFKPDAVLGDMDSLKNRELLKQQPADSIQKFPMDKDYTDTELALDFVRRKADSSAFITLVGGDGGRIDHLLGIYDLFSTALHPDVWLCREQALWYGSAGCSFQIDGLSEKDMISIARPDGTRSGGSIHSEGLTWEYDTFRKDGMPSISNRIKQEYEAEKLPVSIQIQAGTFILILPLQAGVTVLRQKM